jgi:hypothetical protein
MGNQVYEHTAAAKRPAPITRDGFACGQTIEKKGALTTLYVIVVNSPLARRGSIVI